MAHASPIAKKSLRTPPIFGKSAPFLIIMQEQTKMKLAPPQVFQPPFPYSLGIVAQAKRTVYVAGQVALNELVGKDDPEAQARQVFTNMKAVLAAAGATAFIAPLLNPDWLVEVEGVAVIN
jgi:enamine deaminase RidA (YjgF/YER057c/UK114 family)